MDNEKEYEVYKDYIIAPGIQMPSYGIHECKVFKTMEQYKQGSSVHTSESENEAKAWIDKEIGLTGQELLEEVRPFVCPGCGKVLDSVVASFAVLGWDETAEDYTVVKDVGDFACPHCMTAVHREKFYPSE